MSALNIPIWKKLKMDTKHNTNNKNSKDSENRKNSSSGESSLNYNENNDRICISESNYEAKISEYEAVKKAALGALKHENALDRSVSVVLTDNETIHKFNREYRNVDRPTDVLSFPSDEGEQLLMPPDGFLGDIMISVPKAEAQGAELGHSTERELMFLTVHGILHLLGYDHIRPEDEKVMLKAQQNIISLLTEENNKQ